MKFVVVVNLNMKMQLSLYYNENLYDDEYLSLQTKNIDVITNACMQAHARK